MLQFIHLTDCHLQDHSADTYRNIKPYAYLNKIIADINLRHAQYDFILITGDISQTGTEKSYSLFETLLKTLGKPIQVMSTPSTCYQYTPTARILFSTILRLAIVW